jgi:hypothetical protein
MKAANGAMVPLSELVTVERGVIDQPRYTKDMLPVTYVFGDMAGTLDSPLYGLFGIRSSMDQAALPNTGELGEYWISQPKDPYRQYAIKWDGEWQITFETFRDMGAAYGVGLILIYLLVVAQFKSYLTPLIIMAPIPLTIIGVMPGHALLGAQFTATSMIGMIALAGIIVRNSILLVDFVHQQLDAGVDFQQAVIDAAATRAKPIVLTAVAAMLGAVFILDDPIFNGLAIALLFGIFVSTLLTLLVIPVLYYAANYRRLAAPARRPTPSPPDASTFLPETHRDHRSTDPHFRRHLHPAVARARRRGQPALRLEVVAGLHRVRRPEPLPVRLHQRLPARLDPEEAGRAGDPRCPRVRPAASTPRRRSRTPRASWCCA